MIILIDAYNLFKTVLHVQFISDTQRIQFLHCFEKYAQLRPNNQVILVFDGGANLFESEQLYQHITIIYAGAMQSADDVIKKKLSIYQGYDILLITCDRELRKYGARYQIESLGSLEFYKILQNVLTQKNEQQVVIAQTICKTSQEKNIEIDRLMELGSRKLMVKELDKEVKIPIHAFPFDVSKKDKKLLKKIIKI